MEITSQNGGFGKAVNPVLVYVLFKLYHGVLTCHKNYKRVLDLSALITMTLI